MDAPPVIHPPVAPPPLPESVWQPPLQKYIKRCFAICIVSASLCVFAIGGFCLKYVEEGTANWSAFGFVVWLTVVGYGAALLLHYRRSEAYLATMTFLIVLLFFIPVGTVFGILGIGWLGKGRPLLKRA